MQDDLFDILICGAGLIGVSLALALAPLPLRVAVIEALPLRTKINLQSDGRSLALNYASANILQAIGAWPQLVKDATPITSVHVSERGRFGKVRFTAQDENVAALGYVVPAPRVGAALNKMLAARTNLTLFNPATVVNLLRDARGYSARLRTMSGERTIAARLVIAADGTHSTLRDLAGITAQVEEYGQSALATRITTAHPINNVAYERFVKEGALALLPLAQTRAALILTGADNFIQQLNALSEPAFLRAAQVFFGQRLGAFTQVEQRHVYPLRGSNARQQVKDNLILLGNAAHTLHPIAAQGLNSGLQDMALLAEILARAAVKNTDLAALDFAQTYATPRRQAQQRAMRFTQGLITIFAQDFLPMKLARGAGLQLINSLPPLKHRLAARLMGISGELPRLAAGLPLLE